MDSVVCTLFESHYHHGVAALTNSLHHCGFKGSIYAGYRGDLPPWSSKAKANPSLSWDGGRSLEISEDITIHFLPVSTEFHLANYKPAFMIRLLEGPAINAGSIAYFDPDIVIKCRWSFFDGWMKYGVALVHEVTSNDMPVTHPIRGQWKEIISRIHRNVTHEVSSYINSGFCGVSKRDFHFIKIWTEIIEVAIRDFKPDPKKFMSFDRTQPFYSIDQDALNIAAMCYESAISEIGPEGMDFIQGGWTMSHAVGTPKPWKKSFLYSAFKGIAPSLADRAFWLNAMGQIKDFSKVEIQIKRIGISLAALISRFYSR